MISRYIEEGEGNNSSDLLHLIEVQEIASELHNIESNNELHDISFRILSERDLTSNFMLVKANVQDISVFNIVQNNTQIEEADYDKDDSINISGQVNNGICNRVIDKVYT